MAAIVVYQELAGHKRSEMRGPEYIKGLSESATALAQVVEVFYVSAAHGLVRIGQQELAGGRFEDGGNLFRRGSGAVYRSCMVRRGDVYQGVEALRKAGTVIGRAEAPADGTATSH
ncbi:MAG: hypothetical protein ACT4P4_03395 [Betaproteobacteria bacterium]